MSSTRPLFNLQGRIALVTGGSRGIGRACATLLAKQGAYVVIGYINDEPAAFQTLESVTQAGSEGEVRRLDVTDEAASFHVVRDVAARKGSLDLLVCNAGITADELLVGTSMEQAHKLIATNLYGSMHCCKAAVPVMMRRRFGRIVCISSVIAALGNKGQTAYAASKAAIEGFSRSLAREYGKRGINTNVVAPGFVKTDMTAYLSNEAVTALGVQIPVGRVGTPEDVAAVVAFLCSDEAAYVTGQVIGVNGGMHMS